MPCTAFAASICSLPPLPPCPVQLDMWALGVTLYMWVFGVLPFNGAAPFLIYESIKRQELTIPKVRGLLLMP